MSRSLTVVKDNTDRSLIARKAMVCEVGTRFEIKDPKRTLPQNDRMWAMLSDISEQVEHCGRKYETEAWKVLFLHACGREVRFLPGLDGKTFVPWGQSSSDLSREEMSDLISFMFAFGAEKGVVFHDDFMAGRQ